MDYEEIYGDEVKKCKTMITQLTNECNKYEADKANPKYVPADHTKVYAENVRCFDLAKDSHDYWESNITQQLIKAQQEDLRRRYNRLVANVGVVGGFVKYLATMDIKAINDKNEHIINQYLDIKEKYSDIDNRVRSLR